MSISRRCILLAGLGSTLTTLNHAVKAQENFPNKPINMILPFAVGGPTDVVARIVCSRASQLIERPIIVENRPAASGIVANEYVARARPDGYTLLLSTSTMVTSAALGTKLPYHPVKDFTPVIWLATTPLVVVVRRDSPMKTIEDLVDALKKEPGKYTYGTGGTGTIVHVVALQLLQTSGTSSTHIPYKGTAPALTDLIGGRIDYMIDASTSSMGFIRSGQLRALAVTNKSELPVLPGVPTISDTWLKGFEAGTFNGVLAPSGTPDAIVNQLNSIFNKVIAEPEIQGQLIQRGALIAGGTPEQFGVHIRKELTRWTEVLQAAGIHND